MIIVLHKWLLTHSSHFYGNQPETGKCAQVLQIGVGGINDIRTEIISIKNQLLSTGMSNPWPVARLVFRCGPLLILTSSSVF